MAAPTRGKDVVVDISAATRKVQAAPQLTLPPRTRVHSALVSSTDGLVRYLAMEADRLDQIASLLAGTVFGAGVNLRNISLTAGVSKLVEHRLGRAYAGWVVTRLRATSGAKPSVFETTLPTGRNPNQWLQIESPETCTVDVYLF